MMRSLYSGVSGLKTHQTKMDVIGNNIANVNTVAYKSQSITFSELMYQTTQKASGAGETKAGTNAKQIGLGVASGAISTAITQAGSAQSTGNAFDIKITGDSFFIVESGGSNMFTRDGSFYVDAAGYLAMSSTGNFVKGWLPKEDPETGSIDIVKDSVKRLQILSPENMTSEPQATTKANVAGIIDRNDPNVLKDGYPMNLSFYDNLGYAYTAKFKITGTDENGQYTLAISDIMDSNNDSIKDKFDFEIMSGDTATPTVALRQRTISLKEGYTFDGTTLTTPGTPAQTYTLGTDSYDVSTPDRDAIAKAFSFDSWDDMKQLANVSNGAVDEDILAILGAFDSDTSRTAEVTGMQYTSGTAVKLYYDEASGKFKGVNDQSGNSLAFNLSVKPADGNPETNPFEIVEINMADSLNFNNEKNSTISCTSGDKDGFGTGCAIGAMTGVAIQNDGKIYGAYDNGQTKLLGQIAVAKFSNASGLEKQGDNLYAATRNSGEFDGIGLDITSDGGYMQTGVLEMSNVDLSSEFTDMITTQRGFQANSRIITVSDTLLEELVNLKR